MSLPKIKLLLTTYKSVGIISISSIFGAIVTFMALPFITRLYSLEDFAKYGLAISIVSICSVVTMLRLEQALLIVENKEEQYKIIFEGFVFSILFSILLGMIFLLQFSVSFVVCLICGIVSNNLVQLVYNLNFSSEREISCAAINVFKSLSIIIMQLSLPVFYSFELIEVYTLNSLICILLAIFYLIFYKCFKMSFSAYRGYKDLIFSNMPHALLNSFSHNLPYYAIGMFLNVQLIGLYMIVERVLKVPIGLFSQTIRMFYIRKFRQDSNNEVALRHSIIMSLCSLPFFTLFILIPDKIYVLFFGSEWSGIAEMFSILALGYWAIFCNPPASAYLIAHRKSNILLYLQIFELIIKVSLFLILYFYLGDDILVLSAVPISLCFYNFMILYLVKRENEHAKIT